MGPELYSRHKGQFLLRKWKGERAALRPDQRKTVDAVCKFYAKKSSQWLSILTHQEDPWCDARQGLGPGERGSTEITHAALAEY